MFGVISSYRELTGFQPVELTDITLQQQVYCPLTPRTAGSLTSASKARLTPINSSKQSLRNLNNNDLHLANNLRTNRELQSFVKSAKHITFAVDFKLLDL